MLAAYAADAAREVPGVAGLVGGARRHRGVRVTEAEGATTVEVNVALAWGASAPAVGRAVQERVAEYLGHTAKLPSLTVDVVIAGVAAAPAA